MISMIKGATNKFKNNHETQHKKRIRKSIFLGEGERTWERLEYKLLMPRLIIKL